MKEIKTEITKHLDRSGINDTTVEFANKLNKPIALKLNDAVIHKVSGLCGRVEAVESYGNTDGQMIAVLLYNGKHIRGAQRQEFALYTASPAQQRAQAPVTASQTERGEEIIRARMEGPISEASILDELS